MKVLVVGGAGYIGSVVSRRLLAAGHRVVVLDDLSTGHRDAVAREAEFIRASVQDELAVSAALNDGVEAVMHFAARSLVGESVLHPELYWSTNLHGTRALLDAMRRAGTCRLVFSSTAATYGEPASVPIEEDAVTRPTSAYGKSKLAVDLMIEDDAIAHGLSAVSLRYFNVAGAIEDAGERHEPETHLIPNLLRVAAGAAEASTIFGDDYPTPDGTCIRDYIHVDDLATAHILALGATAPQGAVGAGRHRVYNLGNGKGFSVREVLDAARRVTGHPIPTVQAGRRPGDPAILVASSQRIQSELGWSPQRPWIEGMVGDAWRFVQDRGLIR
ncbi:MAG TPA: UDP-glucose 4-epimerase GalE [Candidatus Dormibacteraeota bacterium]|nr:UDP-glucose 4-epimerase GalE [Candidatus Dormibacteraeota bacterium]